MDKFMELFTPYEINVLKMVAAGHTNKEIADELHVSVSTVKTHVHRILEKTGIHDRKHLIVKFYADFQRKNGQYEGGF